MAKLLKSTIELYELINLMYERLYLFFFAAFNYLTVLHTLLKSHFEGKASPTLPLISSYFPHHLLLLSHFFKPKPSKMFTTNHQKPLQMKQEKNDKVFSRVLSKESSMANPSLRVYYGGLPANVPFMWESQPGTPKHNFKDEALPPLTPPPSYFSKNPNKKPFKNNNHSSSNLLRFLLLKLSLKKKHIPKSPSPMSSSSSFSSLFSSKSDLSMRESMTSCRSRFSSPSSSFDYRGDHEEEGVVGSPTSML